MQRIHLVNVTQNPDSCHQQKYNEIFKAKKVYKLGQFVIEKVTRMNLLFKKVEEKSRLEVNAFLTYN